MPPTRSKNGRQSAPPVIRDAIRQLKAPQLPLGRSGEGHTRAHADQALRPSLKQRMKKLQRLESINRAESARIRRTR
jgi:hypothetical protein